MDAGELGDLWSKPAHGLETGAIKGYCQPVFMLFNGKLWYCQPNVHIVNWFLVYCQPQRDNVYKVGRFVFN